MNVVVAYDIEPMDKNPEFRDELTDNGFFIGWKKKGIKYYLPRFCLYKIDTELLTAKNEFLKIADQYNKKNPDNKVKIVRLAVFPSAPWEGIEGEEL